MDWDKLRIFHTVASAGSFTHAGETLGLSQSAVSRQIRTLEDSLQTSLFNRHARGLILTDEGETLFETTKDVVSKIHVTEQKILEGTESPRGKLKITTTSSFGSTWMMHNIKKFIDKYPDIDVQMLVGDQDYDLLTREADVAIRFHPTEHLDLIQKQVATFHYHLFASPSYLNKYGRPQRPEDLDDHDLITYGSKSTSPIEDIDWILDYGTNKKRKPVLEINSIYGMLQAVKSGIGIGSLPDYLVQGSMNITPVLEEYESHEFPAYFVYTQELRNSKRIAAFKDFIVREFKKSIF
ncbi:LysR family transcriptional regulator [Pseudemcibacter aquimaris]|uniref:LysR family transcriptional regulator n=1 Tax=Pseudemcibacter aquimaris TaxID=2857064 RepID=UPI002012A672|nr:LysR family transcriptional regulator [Pseudemcibacter aquimaris]MCC3860899.1 LysR family transcriptional regulator [Pseudemcibacter aquimaris]WDU59718.1 LysR family transcriptional regulator [Pseudemcibacter aquimaris]